jgi:hypothetical protein
MEKGYLYELQIRDYIINSLNKKAYLWKHTPETILINNGIIGSHNENRIKRKENGINPLQDTGIDIIFLENDIKCALVQCKNGYMKGITMENLAGFMCWMATLDKLNGYVYYTDKLSINVKTLPINKRIQFIKQPYIETKIITDMKFHIDPDKLDEVKRYIDMNKKRPNDKNNNTKKMGKWLSMQITNYKTRKQIMINDIIYKSFIDFITSDKYKEYFISMV